MKNIVDRPRIKSIAGNPLILAMIAVLCTDRAFSLSHSRSELYKDATDLLLDKWHRHLNVYDARAKRATLQRLAGRIHEEATDSRRSTATMGFREILDVVKKVMPNVGLNRTRDAQPILDEIVERTGFVISLDGGMRYQFAHLSIQEFFVAEAYLDRASEMLDHFRRNMDLWLEPIKLWCGMVKDASIVISRLAQTDKLMAFECLGEAHTVDADLANGLLRACSIRLGEKDSDYAVINAFAAVSCGQNAIAAKAFEFLENTLGHEGKESRRIAAAFALSRTYLPRAARVLRANLGAGGFVSSALLAMGDVAVPALLGMATSGSVEAILGLQRIATPEAIQSLASLLWHGSRELELQVAWRLATALKDVNIEASLHSFEVKSEWLDKETLPGLWAPFEDGSASLAVLAERIGWLMTQTPDGFVPISDDAVDLRFAIPLCCVVLREEFRVTRSDLLFGKAGTPLTKRASLLLGSMAPELRRSVARVLMRRPRPTLGEWKNVLVPMEYSFPRSAQARLVDGFVVLCQGAASLKLAGLVGHPDLAVSGWAFLCLIAIVLNWIATVFTGKRGGRVSTPIMRLHSHTVQFLRSCFYLCFRFREAVRSAGLAHILGGMIRDGVLGFVADLVVPWSVWLVMGAFLAPADVCRVGVAVGAIVGLSVFSGVRRDLVARNPFNVFVDELKRAHGDAVTTSGSTPIG